MHVANVRETEQTRSVPIRIATSLDTEGWARLRARLWDGTAYDRHLEEIAMMLSRPSGDFIAFLDVVDGTDIRAFAEASLRHDYVNGCETSPVAFLEGIFVRPEHRGSGIGRTLLRSVRSWAHEQGCSELASDADLDNLASHAFHAASGFEETGRVVCFRKLI